MGTLSYFANMSADGYTVDAEGKFDWTDPTDEVLAFINEIEAEVAVYVHGRRMYETMVYWETHEPGDDPNPHMTRYAEIWRGVEKVTHGSACVSSIPGRSRAGASTCTTCRAEAGSFP